MIDLIGDVHGYADELEELLTKLGYSKKDNYYSHPNPNRTVLFVGDYIDRGPKIRETLEIVKQMVDNDSAIALMGNHEYNALTFHFKDPKGGHLREHSIKNILQHYETLYQFRNRVEVPDGEKEYEEYMEWFKTLPLFYETETFRAVHACWDYKSIDYLKKHLQNNRLTDDLIRESAKKETELYEAIEDTLKGKEIKLPEGGEFKDKDGNEREEMRIKWWVDPSGMTYKTISMPTNDKLPEEAVYLKDKDYYKKDDKSVFFGHYWLKGKPSLYQDNICCLDYSVAKDGILAAYSFDDELILDEQKFTSVEKIT
ncbi:phosphoesterase [Subsaximicrobium wynnwilliamsii]|uniref:Phosphoesterase n=1 Tax=Subsaximicrobium wynnwilliamsii TaxID=291179 RepID=A0A5C6ZF22_9FLAO|nr:metallophosphoesterase [Subsaximicrobium wynnwilliamsii]TXD82143.1 phosphoesterase [Subsaximicrobium wynnwilliamsii]TXD87788.1 phosphoesterase [Subsaximicrobium wynnwilliamsii]TXE01599.1 phosphoesterase [Subsaximicrobium wynnwilliamsii]